MPRCPLCFNPMTLVEEEDLRFATCPDSHGIWIADAALRRRLHLDVQNNVDTLAGASLEDLLARISHPADGFRCPGCQKMMLKSKFHPLIPILIDHCTPCRGIWLAADSLRLLRTLHKELLTSDDPDLQRRLEKIGTTRLEIDAWSTRRAQMRRDLENNL